MSTYELLRDPAKYRRAPKMAIRIADGVPVVWDKRSGRMFRLNDMALEILSSIAREDQSIGDIVKNVSKRRDVDAGIVRQDVEKFVMSLLEKGIVIEV
jgi:hypothetical protein